MIDPHSYTSFGDLYSAYVQQSQARLTAAGTVHNDVITAHHTINNMEATQPLHEISKLNMNDRGKLDLARTHYDQLLMAASDPRPTEALLENTIRTHNDLLARGAKFSPEKVEHLKAALVSDLRNQPIAERTQFLRTHARDLESLGIQSHELIITMENQHTTNALLEKLHSKPALLDPATAQVAQTVEKGAPKWFPKFLRTAEGEVSYWKTGGVVAVIAAAVIGIAAHSRKQSSEKEPAPNMQR